MPRAFVQVNGLKTQRFGSGEEIAGSHPGDFILTYHTDWAENPLTPLVLPMEASSSQPCSPVALLPQPETKAALS